MQELIQQLKDKVGLTEDQASQAINTVKDFVKSKLPAAIAGNVDNWFAGLGTTPEQPKKAGLMDQAEDFLEGASDKMEDWAEKAKDKASDIMKEAKDKLSHLFDGGKSDEKK